MADIDNFLKEVAGKGIIPEYEVVVDSSNNPPEAIAEGRLTVDIIFHGSLAEYVRKQLMEPPDRIVSYGYPTTEDKV